MKLDPKQQEAVNRCCSEERLVPVTGVAGTGKTTIIKTAYAQLLEKYPPIEYETRDGEKRTRDQVVLAAPTGKAAKRITEATGIPAQTIHMLLEYGHPGDPDPKTGKVRGVSYPKRDKKHPLRSPVVFVDEYAMVNHEVHRALFDAMPSGGLVRVFGDTNQLPPIENSQALVNKPSPFQQLLKDFNGVVLKTIHRQGEGSGIVSNGDKIKAGHIPQPESDCTVDYTNQPVEQLQRYVQTMLDKGVDFSQVSNQIITPTRRSWVGTHKLNAMLQNIFRPEFDGWLQLERHPWDERKELSVRVRKGDKVINNRNNYELGIFNGESGVVIECDPIDDLLVVDLGDRIVEIPSMIIMNTVKAGKAVQIPVNPQKDLELAYCITTHKAQGSEYEHVVYLMNRSSGMLRTRKNFYTGITRARRQCHIITDQASMAFAVKNTKEISQLGGKKK